MIDIDERFEPWQQQAIQVELRRLPREPQGLTIIRARLSGSVHGEARRRDDGSYSVRLDPAGLSIGAFRFVVRHELHGHVLHDHGLLLSMASSYVSDEEHLVLRGVCEIIADHQAELLGSADRDAYIKLFPADQQSRPSWRASVLEAYARLDSKLRQLADEDLDDESPVPAPRQPAAISSGATANTPVKTSSGSVVYYAR
jgi:hypothetical protein